MAGKWKVAELTPTRVDTPDGSISVSWVNNSDGGVRERKAEAVARLIAAAPDLLEFAEHVRTLAFDFLNEGIRPSHHHMRDLAWEAEKIVSKATRATQPGGQS